jgi:hypothetical protein
MKLTEYQKGFIEALLDERGHIFLAYHDGRKNGRGIYYPTINIMLKSSSMWILEKARDMLGIRKGFNRRKNLYTLTLGELESEELLRQITLIKREQRRLVALEMIDIKKKWIAGSCDKVLPEYKSEVDRLVKSFYAHRDN